MAKNAVLTKLSPDLWSISPVGVSRRISPFFSQLTLSTQKSCVSWTSKLWSFYFHLTLFKLPNHWTDSLNFRHVGSSTCRNNISTIFFPPKVVSGFLWLRELAKSKTYCFYLVRNSRLVRTYAYFAWDGQKSSKMTAVCTECFIWLTEVL